MISVRTRLLCCAAIILGSASAVPAASPNANADLQQCVANLQASGRGFVTGDLDSLGVTEYDVMVGRCRDLIMHGRWRSR